MKNERLVAALLAVAFAGVMNWSYEFVESGIFAYQGMAFEPPAPAFELLSYFLLLVPLLRMDLRATRPSGVAVILLYVTFLIPALFLPYHATKSPASDVMIFVVGLLVSFLVLIEIVRRPVTPAPVSESSWAMFAVTLTTAVAVCVYAVYTTPGFSWSLDIADLYAKRLAAREALGDGSLRGFLIVTAAHGVGPISVVVGISAQSLPLFALGFAAMTFVFFLNGAKYSILLPFVIVGIALVIRFARQRFAIAILLVMSLAISAGALRYLRYGDMAMSESFSRRLIMSKGASSGHYWETFRDTPVRLRDSGIRRVLGLPVARSKSYEIGERYGLGAEDNAGANAWAAGFANFGYAGLLGVSLLIGFVLRYLDRYRTTARIDVTSLLAAVFAFVWGEAAFETSLVSTGVLISLVMVRWYVGTRHWPAARPSDSPVLE